MDSGSIDASANATGGDGGSIKVGGDYQGKNPDIQNANITYFGPDAELKANAGNVGAGGTVIVWADDTTRAYGRLEAKGGSLSGNGGFVETSGKRVLDVVGANVNAGVGGLWLLDPSDLTIAHSGTSTPFAGPFDPAVYGGTLTDASINTAINAGSSVTVQTSGGSYSDIVFDGTAGGGGPIVIDKSTNTFNSTLNINAYGSIVFRGDTTFQTSSSAGSSKLAVVLNADGEGVGGGNKIKSEISSVVTLNGYAPTSTVEVMVGGSVVQRKWENEGTVNLNGASNIIIYDNGSTEYGTFENA